MNENEQKVEAHQPAVDENGRLPADRPRATVISKTSLDEDGEPVLNHKTPEQEKAEDVLAKLRTLWKGTLYTSIYTAYTGLVGWLFLWVDWRAALLAFFAISVTHPLRYIVNSVDKIGWELDTKNKMDSDPLGVKAYQLRLFWGLYAVVMLCNLFLIAQAYYVSDSHWPAVGVFGAIAVIEFLYGQIQSLNKKIAYAYGDFGRS